MTSPMNAAPTSQDEEPPREPFIPDFSEGLETGLYLALLELMDEGLLITSDEVVLEANGAACRLLEREYRELVGQTLESLFPTPKEFLLARGRLFIQGEARGSLQLALPGGRRRQLRFVAAARIRPGVHALILSRDLLADTAASDFPPDRAAASARPDHESAVPDALWPRLAAVLEQPVIVLDEAGLVSAANLAALSALRFERDQLVGQPLEARLDVRWPPADGPQRAELRTDARARPITARILQGPRPGWCVLVLPARGAATGSLPPARSDDTAGRAARALSRRAIAERQLEIHFQPLVDARDQRVQGGEALLRWHHPSRGLTPFGQIGSMVQDPAALAAMSDWALQSACQAARQWPVAIMLTVNVARGQILDNKLHERVAHALNSSGLAAERLQLDFEEDILLDDQSRIAPTLEALHALGVRIAIDDFGRGATSIPRLRRYPVGAIKLDPGLVSGVGHDEASEAVVEAIGAMAGILGLKVLARGVSTRPQQDFLIALGCHLQQGPLFGKPETVADFASQLTRSRARDQ